MSERWVAGETARISIAITDPAGGAVDPAALRLRVRSPAAVATLYTYGVDALVIKDSVGVYRADIVLATGGVWAWRWEADTPSGVVEDQVTVKKSAVL